MSFKEKMKEMKFWKKFKEVNSSITDNGRFTCKKDDCWPCLGDNTGETGFDAHYIYHTAWASRMLSQIKPEKHVDISSDIKFSTMISAFIPIHFYDYRPAQFKLSSLNCGSADLLALPFENNSIHSLSCMHVVEHIGLERYGDSFNPQGDLIAIKELIRVLAVNGTLLFVVPIGGIARIQYNAHRIYTYNQIINAFSELALQDFALIPDDADKAGIVLNATEEQANKQKYGCACFRFVKKQQTTILE